VVQRRGAHIRLPVGEHASVAELLAASMIASANDAMVTLTIAASGSEEAFVAAANQKAQSLGASHTHLANATGLSGGTQYSTAENVAVLLQKAYNDPLLHPFLSQSSGVLTTLEGTTRQYKTTNDLLASYVPIEAGKTGFTYEAGENLAIITQSESGHLIGAVVLGSEHRFQDMKALMDWIERNYTFTRQVR
ncbi:MAG: D-alanyl-D-alanine carboxypeptidase family protein, partial [Acidobacteriota bacterium]